MVKAALQKATASRGARAVHTPRAEKAANPNTTMLSKTIGTMNKMAILAQPVNFSKIKDELEALGEKDAGRLLNELQREGRSIKNPTAWLKSAATRAAAGESSARTDHGRGGKGGGGAQSPEELLQVALGLKAPSAKQRGPQYSPYVSKAIGMLNKEGCLQAPIMYKDVADHLSSVPESLAIDLIKQLSTKAAEVKDPTNWLIASAKKGLEKGNKGTTELSKKIGELNKSGKLSQPVKWSTVCGPMLLISEAEAGALVKELQQKGNSIESPSNWLLSAANKVLKGYTAGAN
jgi:hypothetical protein